MREKPRKMQAAIDDHPSLRHHQRKLRYLKERRKYRRLQISLIRMRAFFRIAATVLIFYLIYIIANLPQWYLGKDIFNYYPNQSLEITGNDIVKTKQIMAVLKPLNLPKKQVFLLNTDEVEKALKTLTPVKRVYIRRFWFPARLKIVIDERTPVLAVSPSPKSKPVAVFTNDDVIIGREFLPLPNTMPYYLILTYVDYSKWSQNHVYYLIYLSKLLEAESGEKLVYIDIRNPYDVFVQLSYVRLRLGELNPTVFKRAKRISSVIGEAIKLKDDIDYIDLRWNNSVSIKLKNKDVNNKDTAKPKDGADPEDQELVNTTKTNIPKNQIQKTNSLNFNDNLNNN